MNLFNDVQRARQRAGRAAARAPPGLHRWRDLGADRAAQDEAAAVLARVGLAGKEHAPAQGLSYGERRALEIAVALARAPRLLFLDEPTAGLGAEAPTRSPTSSPS
jgi:branched-chain amino acid transport system ATP-binding protein